MKAIIQSLDSKKGYIVTTNDGREFIVRNIDEAIKLKEELQNEYSWFSANQCHITLILLYFY